MIRAARRCAVVVVVALLGAPISPGAAATAQTHDRVIGSGVDTFFGAFSFNVHDGHGRASISPPSVEYRLPLAGRVRCAVVRGNFARFNYTSNSLLGTIAVEVTDGGSTGTADTLTATPWGYNNPQDCRLLDGGFHGAIVVGDIQVIDG